MTRWTDAESAAPDLARRVTGRFRAHRHAMLATLRADGSPRLSGLETLFAGGELWLAMMPGSRKSADLLRDPRFALHSMPELDEMGEGDARIGGRAIHTEDEADLAVARAAVEAVAGEASPGPFTLFRVDVEEVTLTWVADDQLHISVWRPGDDVRSFHPT